MNDIESSNDPPGYIASMRGYIASMHGFFASMHGHATIREAINSVNDFVYVSFVGILWLTAATTVGQAREIYKSVDANGHVVYSDHLDASMSQSTVVQLEDSGLPPHELHFCWTNCFTLILDNGVYRRTDGTEETWTVETFSPKAIVLHRHDPPADWNGYSQDVVYAGQVANDRLIGVTVNGKPISGIDASWGIALNTLPANNAERDAKSTTSPNPPSGGSVSTNSTPPPLQAEDQPPLPEDGYIWEPGYWNWRDQGFFWVYGGWVRPPQIGVLWTPPYWAPAGAAFVFHPGHWGPTVGFYGGVNYGHGYSGSGYTGGHWVGNYFAYDSATNHVNPDVAHHTYAGSVPYQASRSGVSFAASATATPSPTPTERSRPTAGVKPSATSAKPSAPDDPATVNRVGPPRATAVKQFEQK